MASKQKFIRPVESINTTLAKRVMTRTRVIEETGQVLWIEDSSYKVWKAGDSCLFDNGDGMSIRLSTAISIAAERYLWYYKNGYMPAEGEIVFLDGNRYNLALSNLSLVPHADEQTEVEDRSVVLRKEAQQAWDKFQEWCLINIIGTKKIK